MLYLYTSVCGRRKIFTGLHGKNIKLRRFVINKNLRCRDREHTVEFRSMHENTIVLCARYYTPCPKHYVENVLV